MPAGLEAASRYANLALRAFGEENDLVPPGILLEPGDLISSPDWEYHKRVHRWSRRDSQPASVGVCDGILVKNTSDRFIVVVTGIHNHTSSTDVPISEISTGAFPANYGAIAEATYRWDGRHKATQISGVGVALKSAGAISASLPGNPSWVLQANTVPGHNQTPLGWYRVLTPGQFIFWETFTTNVVFNCGYFGYIRDTEPGELAS